MFNNVVVGVDDDEGGRDAIALAKMLAAAGQRTHLRPGLSGRHRVVAGYAPRLRDRQHERSAVLEMRRAETGVEAKLRCYGSPSVGRGLHELAELTGADLLVIGSSRRSCWGGF